MSSSARKSLFYRWGLESELRGQWLYCGEIVSQKSTASENISFGGSRFEFGGCDVDVRK
jgi:hypothetical protein